MKKLAVPLGGVALAMTAACTRPDAHAPSLERTPTKVTLTTARVEPLPAIYRTSGTVRGRNTTVVSSKTTGYVRSVRVRPGDVVKAGQTLLQLEANDTRASVAGARALLGQALEAREEAESSLAAARAATSVARTSHERARSLLEKGAIAQQQFDESEAAWLGAQAREKAAEARVRSVTSRIAEGKAGLGEARAALDYADITAPFDGRVLERRVDPGALATPGLPLLVIADEGVLRVETAVEESRANTVNLGDEADLHVETVAHAITGKVTEIVPHVDVTSRAFLVKLDLPPEAGPLRPGAFARVHFHVGTRPRLVVPTTALTAFGALDRIFVADGTTARLRMVTLGEKQGALTEILSGLSPGEPVVAAPPGSLRDGMPIEVQQ